MAKKKKEENELTVLQMPIPSYGQKEKRMTRLSWGGLNRRQTNDTGVLSMESNISTNEVPYLVPSQKRVLKENKQYCGDHLRKRIPISMYGFGQFLVLVYWQEKSTGSTTGDILLDFNGDDGQGSGINITSILKADVSLTDAKNEKSRSIVKFNVYRSITDPAGSDFDERLLIFPDKYSMLADMQEIKRRQNSGTAEEKNNPLDLLPMEPKSSASGQVNLAAIPNIDYAAVHLSRVFGVGRGRVYASHFNNYADWTLDTADEYNEANAWCSETQANSRAEGDFVGITAFQNHVICFKKDYMHEIYNNKNPFRVQDIFAEGCIDNRSIQDVDGRLFFVSRDGVMLYTGSNPKWVGYDLGIDRFDKAVAGNDGRRYYLYCEAKGEKHLFVYDTLAGLWSEETVSEEIVSFAHNQNGMFAFTAEGFVYRLDTAAFDHSWSFETDFIMAQSVDIKHIKKIQLFAHIPEGSWIHVYVLYNNEPFDPGTSQRVYNSGGKTGTFPIRVLPRQTAGYGFKLHFMGYGYVRLYEMEIDITGGGDLYV